MVTSRELCRLALAVVVVLAPAFCLNRVVTAQIAPRANVYKQLVAARSLKCTFPWYAGADWDEDLPQPKSAKQDFAFHIDGIDHAKGAARLIGNAGADDLTTVQGDYSISFVEVVPVGSVNLTTVYGWPDKSGRFKAVHSRHTAIGGPSPSQQYGYCQTW
jgi:hypothetical protein